MQSKYLVQNNSDKLIIFFNGWSADGKIVNHLTTSDYDVLMFNDYSDLEISDEILDEINKYQEIIIIAWSFGVWACGSIMSKFKRLKCAVAINGTLMPIDKNYGIPDRMFNLTLSTLSEDNYLRFFDNMFLNESDLSKLPTRNIENKRNELEAIKELSAQNVDEKKRNLFNKILVGENDKIIPSRNQLAFWSENNIIKIDCGHYAFNLFKTWDEIING